jgi:lipopolysaccharide/colanic/teichoic acid biosynthesis glycosyltransferase
MATFYQHRGKRAFDVSIALVALVATAPVQVATALAVRQKMGSPVLFRQNRPGLGGVPFTLLKFRTMTQGSAADQSVESDAERLTLLGLFCVPAVSMNSPNFGM